jgi:hypothetical protein
LKQSRELKLGIFLVRNLLLYFLFFHAYLYFRDDLDLVFLSVGFVLAVLLALWMYRLGLRLWSSGLLFIVVVVCLRLLFFLVFRLQTAVSPGPHTDFLFFEFDKNFYPGLLPWTVVWLFNLLAFRYPLFQRWEAGFDALLLLAVFWSQGNYRITLYRHPSLLSYVIFVFVLLAIALMVLVRIRDGADRWRSSIRCAASFLWVLIPLQSRCGPVRGWVDEADVFPLRFLPVYQAGKPDRDVRRPGAAVSQAGACGEDPPAPIHSLRL